MVIIENYSCDHKVSRQTASHMLIVSWTFMLTTRSIGTILLMNFTNHSTNILPNIQTCSFTSSHPTSSSSGPDNTHSHPSCVSPRKQRSILPRPSNSPDPNQTQNSWKQIKYMNSEVKVMQVYY